RGMEESTRCPGVVDERVGFGLVAHPLPPPPGGGTRPRAPPRRGAGGCLSLAGGRGDPRHNGAGHRGLHRGLHECPAIRRLSIGRARLAVRLTILHDRLLSRMSDNNFRIANCSSIRCMAMVTLVVGTRRRHSWTKICCVIGFPRSSIPVRYATWISFPQIAGRENTYRPPGSEEPSFRAFCCGLPATTTTTSTGELSDFLSERSSST